MLRIISISPFEAISRCFLSSSLSGWMNGRNFVLIGSGGALYLLKAPKSSYRRRRGGEERWKAWGNEQFQLPICMSSGASESDFYFCCSTHKVPSENDDGGRWWLINHPHLSNNITSSETFFNVNERKSGFEERVSVAFPQTFRITGPQLHVFGGLFASSTHTFVWQANGKYRFWE